MVRNFACRSFDVQVYCLNGVGDLVVIQLQHRLFHHEGTSATTHSLGVVRSPPFSCRAETHSVVEAYRGSYPQIRGGRRICRRHISSFLVVEFEKKTVLKL